MKISTVCGTCRVALNHVKTIFDEVIVWIKGNYNKAECWNNHVIY